MGAARPHFYKVGRMNVIELCANALAALGASPISSFDDGSDGARLCRSFWPRVRDRVLRSHPWNCAIRRAVLAADAEAPEFDFSAQYTLPADWLRTLQVGRAGYMPAYRTEGRKILCNESALPLVYVFRNEDVSSWDSLLVDAMTAAMATVLAYPITESTSLRESFRQELIGLLKEARAVDGQDDPPDTFGDFPLLAARMGGR